MYFAFSISLSQYEIGMPWNSSFFLVNKHLLIWLYSLKVINWLYDFVWMLVKETFDSRSLRLRKIWSRNRIWQHLTCMVLQGLFHRQDFHNVQDFIILLRNFYHYFTFLLIEKKHFMLLKITKSKIISS